MMLDRFTGFGPWLAYVASLLLILGATALGRWLGIRDRRRHPADAGPSLANLESALFTLLALMVGFSFAMALTRFDARRDAILREANAIGTAALRTEALAPSQADASKALLRDYVRLRLDVARNPRSLQRLSTVIAESNGIQQKLWHVAMTATTAEPRSVGIGLYVQALNDMFDLQETRLTAARNQVPDAVFLVLYVIATVAMGFTGYSAGCIGNRGRVPNVIMSVLIATVIGLVVDIDFPRSGLITVSQQPMLDLAASLGM